MEAEKENKKRNLLKPLLDLIELDTEKESESVDLSILVRWLSIIGILHDLLTAITIAFTGNIFLCLGLIFSIGIFCAALIFTYEQKTVNGMYLYIGITLFITTIMSLFVGWRYFYLPIVFSTTMLIYFSSKLSLKTKAIYSIITGIYMLAIFIISGYMPKRTLIDGVPFFLIVCFNIIHCVAAFTCIAYSFCRKFNQNEEKILQYNQKLEQMVSTDALTTLWNRRAMNQHIAKLSAEYTKHQKGFSLAIMDIDFFKKVNDTYGHDMGDYVLKSLAYLMKNHMEGKGHVARWGGEEFLITFENMRYSQAVAEMDALRKKVEVQEFNFKDTLLHISITAGIEEFSMTESIDSVITHADEKLYRGKTDGRNQVVS